MCIFSLAAAAAAAAGTVPPLSLLASPLPPSLGPVELPHWSSASTFPRRGAQGAHSLVSIHFSMVVHGIDDAPPPALTSASGRPLRLLLSRKWAVPPPRIQRR